MNHTNKKIVQYVNKFLRYNCAADILAMGVFPNGKEITESMAAIEATKLIEWADIKDESIAAICIGDGVSPRTGALLVHLTGWSAISIDPLMRDKGKWNNCKRLSWITDVAENISDHVNLSEIRKCIVFAVHSHADLRSSMIPIIRNVKERLAVVSLPCCVNQIMPGGEIPDHDYHDPSIWSEKDRVVVWKNVQLIREKK